MWRLLILAGIFKLVKCDALEVCIGDRDVLIKCQRGEIILINSAEYGRMNVGRCILKSDDFMGCSNDVLPVLDRWCSGRRECTIDVPTKELDERNKNCLEILIKYLEIQYTCLKIDIQCSGSRPTILVESEGIISSQLSDTRACGSSTSPWIITAKPGQTINISMLDFSTESDKSNLVSCARVYGFIVERSLAINQTICGGQHREIELYKSNTNQVHIQVLPRPIRGDRNFILKYAVSGCPELAAPAHAWYKREGNSAIIGCETSNQEWRLTCEGNRWIGEVGNCTQKAAVIVVPESSEKHSFDSVVVMTAIAGGALVLCVIAIVSGTVYIKKYRMHQETKQLTKTYASLEGSLKASYRPVGFEADTAEMMSQSGQWIVSSEPNASYSGHCTCATLPTRPCTTDDRQSIYNSINST